MLSLKQVLPKIFLLTFDNHYDLCMHFLRYQEFYESPKYRQQPFNLLELIRWYSNTYGDGDFTYTNDWAGFNIPSWVLNDFKEKTITDLNQYDRFMLAISDLI